MNPHTTILSVNGKPAFAVLPYDEYLRLIRVEVPEPALGEPGIHIPADGSIPHEVILLMVDKDWSIVRAWREYLGVTQVEMARRLGIRQPSYAAMEAQGARPKKSTRARVAAALGLTFDHLDV